MFKYLALLVVISVALIVPASAAADWICISGCEPRPDPAPPLCYAYWCQAH